MDLIIHSMLPKRLIIGVGKHIEYFVDAEVVREMYNIMTKAKETQDDVRSDKSLKLRVEYSPKEENEEGIFCAIYFGDFSICRMTAQDYNDVQEGFRRFLKWAETYKFKKLKAFIYEVGQEDNDEDTSDLK